MTTCLLLLLSGILFAVQFNANKYFQLYKPDGNSSAVCFALLGKASSAVLFFLCVLLSGEPFTANGYTLLVGGAQAFLNLAVMVFGVYVLKIGSVGAYSVSVMIGGMAVPVLFGACFFDEKMSPARGAALILIAVAVVLSAKGEKKNLTVKAFLLYAVLFLCNGFMGVFTALYTNLWGKGTGDFTFMSVTSAVAVACYLPVLAIARRRERKRGNPPDGESSCRNLTRKQKVFFRLSPFLSGALNGVANLFIVIGTASEGIGSVVSFPLVTGGTILFTSIFSRLFYGEKQSRRTIVGNLLILASLIVFVLY